MTFKTRFRENGDQSDGKTREVDNIYILDFCSVDTEVYNTQVMCEKCQAILLRNK